MGCCWRQFGLSLVTPAPLIGHGSDASGASQPQGHGGAGRTPRSPCPEQLARFWGQQGSKCLSAERFSCPSVQQGLTSTSHPARGDGVWRSRSFILWDSSPGRGILPGASLKELMSALLKSRLVALFLPTKDCPLPCHSQVKGLLTRSAVLKMSGSVPCTLAAVRPLSPGHSQAFGCCRSHPAAARSHQATLHRWGISML